MEIRQRRQAAEKQKSRPSRSRRQLRAPENDNKSADGSLQGRVPHWMNAGLSRDGKATWAVG
jgi:hypothetical protein